MSAAQFHPAEKKGPKVSRGSFLGRLHKRGTVGRTLSRYRQPLPTWM